MTCIIGIASAQPHPTLGNELKGMLAAAHREPWYQQSTYLDDGGHYAVATLSHGHNALGETGQQVQGMNDSLTLFGDIYQAAGWPSGDAAETFLRQYTSEGNRCFAEIKGAFIAAMFDPSTGSLRVVNDRFGQRPLYYLVADGILRFSTSLAALFAAVAQPAVSPGGLAQFFTFGQYLDCDTLFDGVKVLPAGSVLRFDTHSGTLRVESYLAGGVSRITKKSTDEWIDAIAESTASAVQSASRHTDGLGLALSGGLDARTILGLIDHSQVELTTICLGMPGSLDLRCAQQMADAVGCHHHSHLLDEAFLANFESHLDRMIDLTGGQYLSQCIVIPTLPVYREQGIRVLLRGHAGELMHMSKAYAYSLDDQAMAITTRDQVREWLFKHLQSYMLDGVEGDLFLNEYSSAMASAPKEAFDRSFDQIPELDDPRQAIWHSFVNDRLRRETTLSLGKFASICDVRVPLLDAELVDLLLACAGGIKDRRNDPTAYPETISSGVAIDHQRQHRRPDDVWAGDASAE